MDNMSYDEAWRRDFERAAREQRAAAEQAGRAGALTSAPLLCEQRWCETAEGPRPATVGLARCDGNGAWLSCDACAARMLGDARYAVQVVSIDQWRQVSSQREQQIAAQIAAAKTGHDVVSLPASPASEPTSLGPMIGELWADWHKRHLAAGAAARAAREQQAQALAQQQAAAGQRQAGIDQAHGWVTGRMRSWLLAEGVTLLLGLVFVLIAAEMTNPGVNEAGGPEVGIGLALIAVSLIGAVVTIIAAAQAHNYAGHPETYTEKHPLPWILSLLAILVLLGGGAAVIIGLSGEGGPAGKAATNWGVFLILSGLAAGLTWLVMGFLHVTRPQRESYKKWMASLTPQERAAVYAAQAAGLMLAHEAVKHSNERARERRAARARQHEQMRQFIQGLHDKRSQPPQYGQASWSQQEPQPRIWQQP